MGLDMFLYDAKDENDRCEIGYWRKVNCVHGWFVNNVQKGVDDCGIYPVTRDNLLKLKEACVKTLEHKDIKDPYERGLKAREILPPMEGFFFGDRGVSDYYFDDLEYTVEILNKVLDGGRDIVYYQSSW